MQAYGFGDAGCSCPLLTNRPQTPQAPVAPVSHGHRLKRRRGKSRLGCFKYNSHPQVVEVERRRTRTCNSASFLILTLQPLAPPFHPVQAYPAIPPQPSQSSQSYAANPGSASRHPRSAPRRWPPKALDPPKAARTIHCLLSQGHADLCFAFSGLTGGLEIPRLHTTI